MLESFLFYPGLRKKTVAPGAGGLEEHLKTPGHTDLFGQSDAIVKHVLEVKYYQSNLKMLTPIISVFAVQRRKQPALKI